MTTACTRTAAGGNLDVQDSPADRPLRILYLTNGFPYPLTSGYLRHYFLIRELAKRHQVTLLSLARPDLGAENIDAMRPFVEDVQAFYFSNRRPGFAGRLVRDAKLLFGIQPAIDAMRSEAVALHRAKPFDVALISGKQTMPVLKALPGLPFVADICDAASMRVEGRLPHVPWWRRPRLKLAAAFLRRIEKQFATAGCSALFASPRDRDAVVGRQNPNGIVVPNGVDLDYWGRGTTARDGRSIAFTGNMAYAPNADAAMYLAREIFPRVREAVPNAQLLLVGRDPLPELVNFGANHEGITVTGMVDDMRPYLEQTTVFAAPLRFGAGIQNKVLEALAMDAPVVASPVAADGLQTADGTFPPMTVARSTDDYVRAIIAGLKTNSTPDDAGRSFVDRHFSWKQSGLLLERALVSAAREFSKVGQ